MIERIKFRLDLSQKKPKCQEVEGDACMIGSGISKLNLICVFDIDGLM